MAKNKISQAVREEVLGRIQDSGELLAELCLELVQHLCASRIRKSRCRRSQRLVRPTRHFIISTTACT